MSSFVWPMVKPVQLQIANDESGEKQIAAMKIEK